MKDVIYWTIVFIMLMFIFSSEANELPEYNRKEWIHWVDADKDGLTTRQEVLIEENLIKDSLVIVRTDKNKFKIIKGFWVCPYSGDTLTDPKALDIDHVVPLKWVHTRGGYRWRRNKKKKYANYLDYKDHLVSCTMIR